MENQNEFLQIEELESRLEMEATDVDASGSCKWTYTCSGEV
jgi:hypothetical protein